MLESNEYVRKFIMSGKSCFCGRCKSLETAKDTLWQLASVIVLFSVAIKRWLKKLQHRTSGMKII